MHSRQLVALIAQFGQPQARLEYKWLQNAANAQPSRSLPDMLARRLLGEPLQYILGSQPFGPLNLLTRPPVLIPRPETEHWVLKLADRLSSTPQRPKSLLDLGTGSGCISLLLCHLCPLGSIHAHGIDISPHAIQLAMDNAALCGIPTPSPDISHTNNTFETTLTNLLSPAFATNSNIRPPFDVVTSNPPYISWSKYNDLPRSVSDYEDPKALFGGPTGLDFYHAIARLVRLKGFLNPGAVVALEVGHGQAKDVEHIMRTFGHMRNTEIWHDPWGKERTVLAHL